MRKLLGWAPAGRHRTGKHRPGHPKPRTTPKPYIRPADILLRIADWTPGPKGLLA